MVTFGQKDLFMALMLRDVWIKEKIERGVQTYSVSDNKVSPSRERCWLSNRVQLLETKVTALWLWEGQDSGARQRQLCHKAYIQVYCIVNECVTAYFWWMQLMVFGLTYPHPFRTEFPETKRLSAINKSESKTIIPVIMASSWRVKILAALCSHQPLIAFCLVFLVD